MMFSTTAYAELAVKGWNNRIPLEELVFDGKWKANL
jgi:hypothetical protein